MDVLLNGGWQSLTRIWARTKWLRTRSRTKRMADFTLRKKNNMVVNSYSKESALVKYVTSSSTPSVSVNVPASTDTYSLLQVLQTYSN